MTINKNTKSDKNTKKSNKKDTEELVYTFKSVINGNVNKVYGEGDYLALTYGLGAILRENPSLLLDILSTMNKSKIIQPEDI